MIAGIVQARINSSRLPAKVLLDLAGKPILTRVVERLRMAKELDAIIVATSTAERDDPIADLSARLGVRCYRGSEIDVLNRYYWAALSVGADTVVRITSDCPLIDPDIVDEAIRFQKAGQPRPDYVVNEGYPRGFDVEVLSFRALEQAWRDDHDPATREHVTAYITQHPGLFAMAQIDCPEALSHLRLTVDTIEDYQLLYKIFQELGHSHFGWRDVGNLLKHRREWLRLNAHVRQLRVSVTSDSGRKPA